MEFLEFCYIAAMEWWIGIQPFLTFGNFMQFLTWYFVADGIKDVLMGNYEEGIFKIVFSLMAEWQALWGLMSKIPNLFKSSNVVTNTVTTAVEVENVIVNTEKTVIQAENKTVSAEVNAEKNIVQEQGALETTIAETKTGTVWDDIVATQPTYPGSVLPKSFELTVPNGNKVWVHGNATEHIAEFIKMKAVNYTPEVVRLTTQQILRSLQSAVNLATKEGIIYNEMMVIGGWELKFAAPRADGLLPVIMHARML
jgi:filamentous hemagglutinin